MKVFIDTSAFVALRNSADPDHGPARAARSQLVDEGSQLFTSNFVFSETHAALLVRVSRDEAIRWGQELRASRAVEIVRIDEETEQRAWEILETHADKLWSHVDATSFALMEREGATDALAFDQHFVQRGLRVVPGP